jgi:hypothetical protein
MSAARWAQAARRIDVSGAVCAEWLLKVGRRQRLVEPRRKTLLEAMLVLLDFLAISDFSTATHADNHIFVCHRTFKCGH